MLSLLLHWRSLKWVVPGFVMLGTAPCYLTVWGVWRLLTVILPRRVYRRGDDILYSIYQRLVLFFFENYSGVEVVFYGHTDQILQKRENVIYISNHQSTVDWIITDMLAVRQGSLGHIRYILKDGLRFLPLYGFYFRQHGCIYVNRSGKFNQEKARRQLAELKEENVPDAKGFNKHNQPVPSMKKLARLSTIVDFLSADERSTMVWLVVFPEGTRYNPQLKNVIERSRKFARERGLTEYSQLLTPRIKAFQLGVEQLSGHVDAVYDVTITYSNTTDTKTGERVVSPGMPDFLAGKSPKVYIHMERIVMADIPEDEGKLHEWLFKRFVIKDRLLSYFYSNDPAKNGCFPFKHVKSKLSLRQTLPSFLLCSTVLALSLATETGRFYYLRAAAFGTLGGCLWMMVF